MWLTAKCFLFASLLTLASFHLTSPQWASTTLDALQAKEETQQTQLQIISVEKIWDEAEHNAFTDLIDFQGALFCTFRESDDHAAGKDGTIRILRSEDGFSWTSVALLSKDGVDLRDPKLSIMPNGKLMLTLGGSIYHPKENVTGGPHVAFSDDGIIWSDPLNINTASGWVWRVTWHKGVGYGVSYGEFPDPTTGEKAWGIRLYKTVDGIQYTQITKMEVPNFPSEVTLRFLSDDTMVAFVRRHGKGWIGTSKPSYQEWNWSETSTPVGGQNFLVFPNGQMWASSRSYKIVSETDYETYTAVGPMTLTSFEPELILPSGGDTSYPGMVYRNGILYVSYYSSHEGKTSIYLAQILLPEGVETVAQVNQ